MYNNERVIIDTRKYDIDEMLFGISKVKLYFMKKSVLHGSDGKK